MKIPLWLVERVLPPTPDGRSTVGDVLEEYRRRSPGLRREIWLWTVVVDIVIRYLPSRGTAAAAVLIRDLRFAVRLARRSPVMTGSAVVSLGLGIGVCMAAFTLANALWIRRGLAADPALVKIWRDYRTGDSAGSSWGWPTGELEQLRIRAHSIQLAGVLPKDEPVIEEASDPTTQTVAFVTGGYFRLLRSRPYLGRLVDPSDDRPGAGSAVVIDEQHWRIHDRADPGVIGRTLSIRGVVFTVVGIVPHDFVDPSNRPVTIWAPLAAIDRLPVDAVQAPSWRSGLPLAIGRMQPGTTLATAQAELSALVSKLTPAPNVPPASTVQVSLATSDEERALDRQILIGVFGIIGLVLALACANVSNILLASTASRGHETAVRQACGASRARLACQFGLEAGALVFVASACGMVLSRWLAPILAIAIGAPSIDLEPDARVYVFLLFVTTVAAIGTALAPTFEAARQGLGGMLAIRFGWSGRQSRATTAFVGLQAAAAIVLITLASLQVRALVSLAWTDPGFDVDSLVLVSIDFVRQFDDQTTHNQAFWTEALERVRALPGVDHAAMASFVPFGVTFGDPEALQEDAIDAEFFRTLRTKLIRGRSFTAAEISSHARLAVIGENTARRYWGQSDPIGAMASRLDSDLADVEVIGVVPDLILDSRSNLRSRMVYTPFAFGDTSEIVVRSRAPRALAATLLAVVRPLAPSLDPRLTVLADVNASKLERPRRYAAIASAVAAFGLLLSFVGILGMTAHAVNLRIREVGIRMALGARSSDVLVLIVRQGLTAVAIGVAAGFGVALLAGRAMAGLFFGLSDRDPLALASAISLMLATSTVAVFLPTRRATRIDPALTLREN